MRTNGISRLSISGTSHRRRPFLNLRLRKGSVQYCVAPVSKLPAAPLFVNAHKINYRTFHNETKGFVNIYLSMNPRKRMFYFDMSEPRFAILGPSLQ
jgi:hypothetical protein